MHARLYRSRTNAMIGGVCGGLAEYLRIDATLVRLFFVLLAFGDGAGVLLYVILWLIMPREGSPEGTSWEQHVRTGAGEVAQRARSMGEDVSQGLRAPRTEAGLIVGAALIGLGVIFLLENLNIPWLWWLDFDLLWPLLLVAAGILMLVRWFGEER